MMDAQDVINVLIGIMLAGGGWFARSIVADMKELTSDLHTLEIDLPSRYVLKADFAQAFFEIKAGLQRIEDKLDGKADK